MKNNRWVIYIYIFAVLLLITFFPVIVFINKIEFDTIMFVNQWLSIFGSSIIMALFFYAITQFIIHYEKIYDDKKILSSMTIILYEIKNYFIERKISYKTEMLFKLRLLFYYTNGYNNKTKYSLFEDINLFTDSIEPDIRCLDSTNEDLRLSISKVDKIIEKINNYGKRN